VIFIALTFKHIYVCIPIEAPFLFLSSDIFLFAFYLIISTFTLLQIGYKTVLFRYDVQSSFFLRGWGWR